METFLRSTFWFFLAPGKRSSICLRSMGLITHRAKGAITHKQNDPPTQLIIKISDFTNILFILH